MRGGLEREPAKPFADPRAAHCGWFRVGGVSVELTAGRRDDVALGSPLELFRVDDGDSDVGIQISWVDSLAVTPGRQLFDSGSVWRLYDNEEQFQFDFSAPVFGEQPYKRLIVDRQFRRATLQMSEECFGATAYAGAALEYPLDELLIVHRLTQEKAIELHGCGIVRADGVGNLFVGHSGAGKSTTTQLWTAREEVEVLSDDRIIVRENGGQMLMYGTPWHGEAAFASPGNAPLARIFVLEHGRGNVLTRLSRSQAVAELFARSFVPFHRHEYVDSALMFLQELIEAVPCYRFAFEPDQGAVETILKLRD